MKMVIFTFGKCARDVADMACSTPDIAWAVTAELADGVYAPPPVRGSAAPDTGAGVGLAGADPARYAPEPVNGSAPEVVAGGRCVVADPAR